jgi:hypothetical protein
MDRTLRFVPQRLEMDKTQRFVVQKTQRFAM